MINSLYGRVWMREPEYHSFVVNVVNCGKIDDIINFFSIENYVEINDIWKCEGRRNVKKQNKRKIGNVFGKQKKTV